MPIILPAQSWSIVPAVQKGTPARQRILLVGQKLDSGSESAGLVQDIGTDSSVWNTQFGRRSQIANMIRVFRRENEVNDLDVYALDDSGTATAATGSILVSGSATEDATLYISVGSAKDHRVTISITSGDSADTIGTAIETAFGLELDAPYTASNTAGDVTFTASNGGTLANDWSIKIEGSCAGITTTITGWSGGANDPTLSGLVTAISNLRYQTIVWGSSTWDETDIMTELDARFNVEYKIMDGILISTVVGTASECTSYADQNSQSMVVFGNKSVSRAKLDGAAVPEYSFSISSQFAALRALRYTADTVLTQYQTTTASYDQFGGAHVRSLPYHNSRMPNLPVAEEIDEFTLVEMNETLIDGGVSVISSNRTYNAVILGDVVTTYLNNAAGNADTSFKYLNTVDQETYVREYFYEQIRSQKSQSRLTAGDVADGYSIDNEDTLRAFCLGVYQDLATLQLVQSGKLAEKDFLQYLTVTLDLTNGKVTFAMSPLLVSQMRSVIGSIQIAFSR